MLTILSITKAGEWVRDCCDVAIEYKENEDE